MLRTSYELLCVACLISASGCGSNSSVVPVSGKVLVDGAPLEHGAIMFIPPSARPSSGVINKDGRFSLSCYDTGDGAVRGRHKVIITASEPLADDRCRWHAPKKYSDESTSNIEIEISAPLEDLTIDLSWDGGGPFVEQ